MNELAALYGVKLSNKPMTCCKVGYSEVMRVPKRLLALHVLTYAGFGIIYFCSDGIQHPQADFSMSYRDALSLALRNVMFLHIVPRAFSTLSTMPKKFRDLGQATKELQRYMEEMLARERQLVSKRQPVQGNLTSALIRASKEVKELGDDESMQGLRDEEIFGSIFYIILPDTKQRQTLSLLPLCF